MPWRLFALAVALILMGPACPRRSVAETPPRPNILLIIADDLGWPFYGFMGHPVVKTPNIDALAAEGVVYPNGQVTWPACEQSLRALGRGLHNRDVDRADDTQTLLPVALAQAGYRTWGAGKWRDGTPLMASFTDAKATNLHIGREPGSMALMFDAVDTMTASGSPWFVWFAPPIPHAPHDAPEPFRSMYAGVDPDPDDVLRLEYGVPGTRKYYAMISWLDALVGETVAFLASRGLLESTLIVFLSDNGAGLQMSKSAFREAGMRTPIVFRGPGAVGPRVDPALVASIDLYPTFMEMAGTSAPAFPDARSLVPSLAGGPAPRDGWPSNMTSSGDYAWRQGDVKVYTSKAGAVKRVSDLAADPFETVDWQATPIGSEAIHALKPALDAWRLRVEP